MKLKVIAFSALWSQGFISPALASMQDIVLLDSELKLAICQQDWRKAIEIADKMVREPELSEQYRQILLHLQKRFEFYVSSGIEVEGTFCSFSNGSEVNWSRSSVMVYAAASRSGSTNSPHTFNPYRLGGVGDGIPGNGANTGIIRRITAAASVGSGYSGNCQFAGNSDAAGNRCGGRAASERPGGF